MNRPFCITRRIFPVTLDKVMGYVVILFDVKNKQKSFKNMEKTNLAPNISGNIASREKGQSFLDLAKAVLAFESERAQEVVQKRFGLAQKEPQTLEKIGQDYNITRERIRQIISDVMKKVSGKSADSNFQKAEERIIFTIKKNHGIMEAQKLIKELSGGSELEANAIAFFGTVSKEIKSVEEKELIKKSWVISEDAVRKTKEIAQAVSGIFQKEKRLLNDLELVGKMSQSAGLKAKYGDAELLSCLGALVNVKKNAFGKWGLADWKEVSPNGTRERIYLILKEKKKPLHFTEIAKLIDEYKLGKRKAHPQTVHNELIKDERFVLVGRGIYALREWGYEEGTIKDVLEDILKKSQKPLSKDEILMEVLRKRKVKKATVMINLNNPKIFVREHNSYRIRQ